MPLSSRPGTRLQDSQSPSRARDAGWRADRRDPVPFTNYMFSKTCRHFERRRERTFLAGTTSCNWLIQGSQSQRSVRILCCPSHLLVFTFPSFRPCDEYSRRRYTVGCAEEAGSDSNTGRGVAVRWGPRSCPDGNNHTSPCLPSSLISFPSP